MGEVTMEEAFLRYLDEMDNKKGLLVNYLRTQNGTACFKCGVIGKHYFCSDNLLLYLYDKKWWCEKCLPEGAGK